MHERAPRGIVEINKPPAPKGAGRYFGNPQQKEQRMTAPIVSEGMRTPWGRAQTAEILTPWAGIVSTAGHGGLKIDAAHNRRMPKEWRCPGGWYEEDCDVSLAMLVFDELHQVTFDKWKMADATNRRTGKPWTLDEWRGLSRQTALGYDNWVGYEAFFGVTLEPGESRGKDEWMWRKANEGAWMAVVGFCSGHPGWKGEPIPEGHTGFGASVNGRGWQWSNTAPEHVITGGNAIRYFICKSDAYRWHYNSRGRAGDPSAFDMIAVHADGTLNPECREVTHTWEGAPTTTKRVA